MSNSNKTVWILSPDFWGKNFLSKHNYAIQMASMGYNVYFFEPSYNSFKKKVSQRIPENTNGVKVVSYGTYLPFKMRQPLFIRTLFLKFLGKMLMKYTQEPDIVISFDSINYPNLRKLSNAYNVLHLIDLNYSYPVNRNYCFADLVLTVSTATKEWYTQRYGKNKIIVIGHGLSDVFVQNAKKTGYLAKTNDATEGSSKIRLAYFGSLFQSILDKDYFIEIIKKYPSIEFDIVGPYDPVELNHGGMVNDATISFIETLKTLPNVQLYGTKTPLTLFQY
jgi:glycosyltransferase involved in cell wall biosynthesis